MRWRTSLGLVPILMLAAGGGAHAQTSYSYDALGRLKVVTPTSGLQYCYNYDAADNRTKVTVSPTCVPSAPYAATDYDYEYTFGWTWSGYIDVLANDTDANLPYDTLTITAVTGCSCAYSIGNLIYFSGGPGYYPLQYTIKDSTNQTSSALLFLYVISCNPSCIEP